MQTIETPMADEDVKILRRQIWRGGVAAAQREACEKGYHASIVSAEIIAAVVSLGAHLMHQFGMSREQFLFVCRAAAEEEWEVEVKMAWGPGKYDDVATRVREETQGEAVIVIVFEGKDGSGFSVQAPLATTMSLPKVLRRVADAIEADLVNSFQPMEMPVEDNGDGVQPEAGAGEVTSGS